MNYIINPYIFYWIGVCATLNDIFTFISAALVVCIPMYILWCALEGTIGNRKRSVKKLLCLTAAVIMISTFIPSEDTMIKILIAKTVTAENIGLTVDSIKSAADYIVQAINSLK